MVVMTNTGRNVFLWRPVNSTLPQNGVLSIRRISIRQISTRRISIRRMPVFFQFAEGCCYAPEFRGPKFRSSAMPPNFHNSLAGCALLRKLDNSALLRHLFCLFYLSSLRNSCLIANLCLLVTLSYSLVINSCVLTAT